MTTTTDARQTAVETSRLNKWYSSYHVLKNVKHLDVFQAGRIIVADPAPFFDAPPNRRTKMLL